MRHRHHHTNILLQLIMPRQIPLRLRMTQRGHGHPAALGDGGCFAAAVVHGEGELFDYGGALGGVGDEAFQQGVHLLDQRKTLLFTFFVRRHFFYLLLLRATALHG